MKTIRSFPFFLCLLIAFPGCCCAGRALSLVMGGRAHIRADAEVHIPFELIGHLIVVKGRINGSGRDFTFILDTGAMTVIDKAVAGKLGLAGEAACEVRGSTGAGKTVCLTRLKSLALGGFKAEGISAAVFDLDSLRRSTGIRVDGAVGSNFLRFFKVKIDYRRRIVTLSGDTAPLAPVPGGTLVEIGRDWERAFAPLVEVESGDSSFMAAIDTGLGDAVSLPRSLLDGTNVEAEIDGNGAMGGGAFGSMDKARLVRLNGLRIGPLQVGKVIASSQEGEKYALIGYDLLSNFIVTIDYPAKQMLLVPVEGGRRIDNVFSTGIALSRDNAGNTLVSGTWDGSPARRLGIAAGDEITAINGRAAAGFTFPELQKILHDDAIKTIDLSIKKPNGEKEFTIRKEYLFSGRRAKS